MKENVGEEKKPAKLTEQKRIAFTAIEQQEIELHNLGEDIWRYSEIAGLEVKSHNRICSFLRKKGFKVEDNYMGFQHAFCATFGDDEMGGAPHPNVAFLCVYDADPYSNHSHGHNLVTVNSLTAALGIQTVIKFSSDHLGKITVIGCPGSVYKNTKIAMFEAGCFKGIDFIFAGFPSHYTNINPSFVGCKSMKVTYRGQVRSPNDRPWEGANPMNACVLAYQNVNALRQNFLPDWTVKCVISSGGQRANVQPDVSTMEFLLKAPKPADMKTLLDKLNNCFTAAATATGCKVEMEPIQSEFLCNVVCPTLGDLYKVNADLNGFTFHNMRSDMEEEDDIANVSTSIPTLKYFYYAGSPTAAKCGTDEFNRFVGSKDCQFMSLVQGKTLAMMAVDLMTKPQLMSLIFDQHQGALLMQQGNNQLC